VHPGLDVVGDGDAGPLCCAASCAALTTSGGGVSAGGAAIRTSMPSRAPVTSSERATLLRPSPVKQ